MNATSINSVMTKKTPLISNDVKHILEYVFQISLFFITSLFGVVVNIINIIVYKKQGLRDSITVGFFVLSLSDLLVVFCPLAISAAYIATFLLPDAPYDFVGFPYVSTHSLRQMAYSFSTLLTAFLSIERCCCVISPFKVKSIFTRTRTSIAILLLFLFHVACYAPVFATTQMRWMQDPRRNNTRVLKVWFAPKRQEIEAFNFTAMSIISPAIAQVIVICSSSILVYGLRASSKFRQIATGKSNYEKEDLSSGMTARDARLVRSMVFLCGILSACNLPYLGFICLMLLEPEINIGKAYHNTYSVASSVTFVLATVNAFSNVFVYYNTSTKYSQAFREVVHCGNRKWEGNDNEKSKTVTDHRKGI